MFVGDFLFGEGRARREREGGGGRVSCLVMCCRSSYRLRTAGLAARVAGASCFGVVNCSGEGGGWRVTFCRNIS